MPKAQTAGTTDPPDEEIHVPVQRQGDGTDDKPSVSKPKQLNLARFLQAKPQNSGIRALLLAKYSAAVKTIEEWEIDLKDLLGKKTK
jgi:hypothetical protein